MGIFTLEVAGRPIACIRAETSDEAEQALEDPWFRDGLLGSGEKHHAVWAGDAEVHIREASVEERALIEDLRDEVAETLFFPLVSGESAEAHQFILASRVEHTPAFNEAGEQIGHIADLSIDRRTGQVHYALMSFGGFLGIGKRYHPVPWRMLKYDARIAGYIVPLNKDELKAAPHYDADELRDLGGAAVEDPFASSVLKYYGPIGPPMI